MQVKLNVVMCAAVALFALSLFTGQSAALDEAAFEKHFHKQLPIKFPARPARSRAARS